MASALLRRVGLYFLSMGLAYMFGVRPTEEQIEQDKRWREERRLEKEARAAIRKREKEAEKKAAAEEKAAAAAAKKAK